MSTPNVFSATNNFLSAIVSMVAALFSKPKPPKETIKAEEGEKKPAETPQPVAKITEPEIIANPEEIAKLKEIVDPKMVEPEINIAPLVAQFCDPLENMKIRKNRASNLFGVVRENNTKNHQGFDYYAVPGTKFKAVADGVIKKIVNPANGDYGIQLVLKIDNTNYYAFYAHLLKIYENIKLNTKVKKGDWLGETGNSGNASTLKGGDQHLHFECRTEIAPGFGLGGRLDPNLIVNTKFFTQNANTIQTNTSVIKIDADGKETLMKIE